MSVLINRIVSSFLYLISLLPFWVLYIFADILFVLLYYVVGYRRNVVETNLKNAFPNKNIAERKTIARKFFRFLADTIVETIKLRSISESELKKRFKLKNQEEVSQYLDNNQSVLIATGHYANWEWSAPGNSVYFKEPLMIIYKPQSNKSFEADINTMRSRFGAVMVPMKQALRQIVSYSKKPFIATLLADQTPIQTTTNFYLQFLNQPTAVFLGVEKIAKITGRPIVFYYTNRIKRGYQEGIFSTLVADPKSTNEYEITKLYHQEMERIINQRPELWLWSHKRWKFKPQHTNE